MGYQALDYTLINSIETLDLHFLSLQNKKEMREWKKYKEDMNFERSAIPVCVIMRDIYKRSAQWKKVKDLDMKFEVFYVDYYGKEQYLNMQRSMKNK